MEESLYQNIKEDINPTQMTILAAEDVQTNYDLLVAFLSGSYNLIHAKNGEEAIELQEKHNPDLILMDLKMPIMNGFEATRKIKEKHKNIPIIAITSYSNEMSQDDAIEAGCDDYITKPVRIKVLLDVLDKHLK